MKSTTIRSLLIIVSATTVTLSMIRADSSEAGLKDREYTIGVLRKLADPILYPLSDNRLHTVLPRKEWETNDGAFHTSPLQAFGRTLSGIAPWLSLGADETDEGKVRAEYVRLSLQGIINATDPQSLDFMFEKHITQTIVHTAYLAYPLLIAPDQLWEPLTQKQRDKVIDALKHHRNFKPWESNWLLFSAIIECAIWKFTGDDSNFQAIQYAVDRHMEWYLGDGIYGDGPEYNWNHYNSYVIHPLLLETLKVCKDQGHELGGLLPVVKARAMRYAEILESMISPEGAFPTVGRSSVYRFAFFKALGYVAYRWDLPESLDPGATRAGITAVIRRMIEAPGTFDEDGWLNAGIVGHQVEARDVYNYTGALYMCVMGLTHLGLPEDSEFWSDEPGKWLQARIWSGEEVKNMKAYHDKK